MCRRPEPRYCVALPANVTDNNVVDLVFLDPRCEVGVDLDVVFEILLFDGGQQAREPLECVVVAANPEEATTCQ